MFNMNNDFLKGKDKDYISYLNFILIVFYGFIIVVYLIYIMVFIIKYICKYFWVDNRDSLIRYIRNWYEVKFVKGKFVDWLSSD